MHPSTAQTTQFGKPASLFFSGEMELKKELNLGIDDCESS
jgi:hypothetical protein